MDILGAVNRKFVKPQVDALAWAAGQTADAARFMDSLSHRRNIDWQASYLGKELRDRGLPRELADPFAFQQAREQDINTSDERYAALPELAALLRAQMHHHR